MALLIVLGAVGLMLLAVWGWRSRGDARSLARHERAVTVLRGMADRTVRAPDVGEGGTGHVRVVDANPDNAFRPSTFWAGRPEPQGASVAHSITPLAAASTTGSATPARRSPARRRAPLRERRAVVDPARQRRRGSSRTERCQGRAADCELDAVQRQLHVRVTVTDGDRRTPMDPACCGGSPCPVSLQPRRREPS